MSGIRLPTLKSPINVGEKYKMIKIIGQGTFGMVWEAINLETEERVAIKQITRIFEDLHQAKRLLREIAIMKRLNHPNVVKVKEVIVTANAETFTEMYIVMEHAQSDLKRLIKSSIFLQEMHMKIIQYNLLCAMNYIHSANILHRDLKPANILVNEDCNVKICDFGLARTDPGEADSQGSTESSDNSMEIEPDQPVIDPLARKWKKSRSLIVPPTVAEQIESTYTSWKTSEDAKVTKPKPKPRGKLVRSKSKNISLTKQMTGHVVTRWYRAPELILMEREYTKAIDVWSVGCIIAELWSMQQENAPTFLERKPLFPGNSCFPLSPDLSTENRRAGFPCSQDDQLNVIFNTIGTPSEEDLALITDEKAISYLQSFGYIEKASLQGKYPGTHEAVIQMIESWLKFNASNRPTLQQILANPYFDGLRDPNKEQAASIPASFEFENYPNVSIEELREYFIAEVDHFIVIN